LAKTTRPDAWWANPVRFPGLSAFVILLHLGAFQGEHYTAGPYLSPFYSPELSVLRRTRCLDRSQLGGQVGWSFRPRF
jgi:hypothetical protein